MKITTTIITSVFAFLLATSCCWIPWLVVVAGGSIVSATAFSAKLDAYSGPMWLIGTGLLGYASYTFWKKRQQAEIAHPVVLLSCITCPECGFSKNETMPTDACQFFYECENCHRLLKPLSGDCCVFCSYGTVKCPPMQSGEKNCC